MKAHKPKTLIQWLQIYILYHKSFPVNEKKPFSMILSTYRKGNTDVWYLSYKGHFAGLAITINSADTILLDYYAISPHMRGRGIGSLILRNMQKHYAPKGLLIEIESCTPDAPNLKERARRKDFYLRNHMVPLNIDITLFGVEMELLGHNCRIDFPKYKSIYRNNYGKLLAKNVKRR
ncbi:MAG: GNAT family N-acetyltransferase [Lachnospiraceae bacterium]|nr:GNAT family N-acetyltransferase [Lachnospiraceae bacterium]